MATSLEQVSKDAMQLPSHQRLALAAFLLEIDGSTPDPAADAAWEEEIRTRIQAVDSGAVIGIPYQDVMREADRRLAP